MPIRETEARASGDDQDGRVAGVADAINTTAICPPCGAQIDLLRARVHQIIDGRVVQFCSPECGERGLQPPDPEPPPPIDVKRRLSPFRWLALVSPLMVAAGTLLGVRVTLNNGTATAAMSQFRAQDPLPLPPAMNAEYGPELPPADFFIEENVWYHPLRGPVRRLPERATRRFGAKRDHESPDSCDRGHCGVDIGEVRGEAVIAVRDGFVERVVRHVGDDRGGRYVRLLHKNGTLVSQYMHLDEIEPDLQRGSFVRAGEKIGTVGETGVKNSGPHLHFTLSLRDGEHSSEQFIDPEPLLYLWPLYPR